MTLHDLKRNDKVDRYISTIEKPMVLTVTQITNDKIICGDWEFDRETGAEIDEFLGWNSHVTGSYIKVHEEK
jgi:hypothetical protein